MDERIKTLGNGKRVLLLYTSKLCTARVFGSRYLIILVNNHSVKLPIFFFKQSTIAKDLCWHERRFTRASALMKKFLAPPAYMLLLESKLRFSPSLYKRPAGACFYLWSTHSLTLFCSLLSLSNAQLSKMANEIRHFVLNTGAKIPSVGLGTWQSDPGVVGNAVAAAIKVFPNFSFFTFCFF